MMMAINNSLGAPEIITSSSLNKLNKFPSIYYLMKILRVFTHKYIFDHYDVGWEILYYKRLQYPPIVNTKYM